MTASRTYIPLKVKLAATLCQMLREEDGKLVPIIPYSDAKLMSAEQIISLFHFDHWPVRHADGGPAEPWNLVPRPISEHREKTAKIDVPAVAKTKRLTRAQEECRRRMLAKVTGEETPEPRRKWSWPKRKMRNRSATNRSAT